MFQIGQNIKTVRQFTDLNQFGFAEAFGVIGRNGKPSPDVLSTYERGITPPPPELIRAIAKAAGIDPGRFSNETISVDEINEVSLPNELSDRAQASSFQDAEKEVDFKERYYLQLEENNRLLKSQVSQLQAQLEKTEQRLNVLEKIEKRQLTIAKFQGQVDEALLTFVANQSGVKDVTSFLAEVYNKSPLEVNPLLDHVEDSVDLGSLSK